MKKNYTLNLLSEDKINYIIRTLHFLQNIKQEILYLQNKDLNLDYNKLIDQYIKYYTEYELIKIQILILLNQQTSGCWDINFDFVKWEIEFL